MFKKTIITMLILAMLLLSACAQSAPVADVENEKIPPVVTEENTVAEQEKGITMPVDEEEADPTEEDTTAAAEEEEAAAVEEVPEAENTEESNDDEEVEADEGESTTIVVDDTEELTEEEQAIIDSILGAFDDDLGGTNPRVDEGEDNGDNNNGNNGNDTSGEEQQSEGNYGYNENGYPYARSAEQAQAVIDNFVANYKNTTSYANLSENALTHLDENLNCIQNSPELSASVSSLIETYKRGEIDEEMFMFSLRCWIEGGGLFGTTNIIVQ